MNINFTPSSLMFQKSEYKNPRLFIKEDRMVDTFIKTVKIDTGSDENFAGKKSPTTPNQLVLAEYLARELKNIGMENVELDENGFVTGVMPSNTKNAPTLAFFAHMDTCSDCKTGPVNPLFHDYKEGDIKLNGVAIQEDELKNYKNHKIITSDGTTLLGGDDKAGIAEIIEALRVFSEHPELKRPEIKVVFTPDEEIGAGIDFFDVSKFNANVAYTVDGEGPENIDDETFNAYNPIIKIKGVPTHYGHAYGKMVNSILIANDLINELPKSETPETTKDKDGYYCVDKITGNSEETQVKLVIRDFDSEKIKKRLEFIKQIVLKLINKYPEAKIEYSENHMYNNMKNYIEKTPEIIEYTKKGVELSDLEPKETSIRGGTDGSSLSERGLPTPNIGAGGVNFHSPKEFISVDIMKKCCENIINIAQVWANEKNPFINK